MSDKRSFDTSFPTARVGFKTNAGFGKSDAAHECCGCGVPTQWFHLGLLLFFCSQQCYETFTSRKDAATCLDYTSLEQKTIRVRHKATGHKGIVISRNDGTLTVIHEATKSVVRWPAKSVEIIDGESRRGFS